MSLSYRLHLPWRFTFFQIWWTRHMDWQLIRSEPGSTFHMFFEWQLNAGPLRLRKWNTYARKGNWDDYPH